MQLNHLEILQALLQPVAVVDEAINLIFTNQALEKDPIYQKILIDKVVVENLKQLFAKNELPAELNLPNYPSLNQQLNIQCSLLPNNVDAVQYVLHFQLASSHFPSEDIFKVTVENAAHLILIHNLSGEIIFLSKAFESMLGYSIAEVKGRNMPDFVHPDESDNAKDFIKRCLIEKPLEASLEFKGIHKSGKTLWLKTTVRTHFNDKGEAIGFQSALQDITAQKQYEDSLLKSREQYQYLFENNPNPLLIVDSDEGNILKINQAALTMYGYPEKELLGLQLYHLFAKDELDSFKARWQKKQVDKYFQLLQLTQQRKNGEIFYANYYGHKFQYEDKDCDLVLVVDISHQVFMELSIRERLEEEQRMSEELRASEEELKQSIEAYHKVNLQLQESESRFRSLSQNAPIGIYLTDEEGNCLWANAMMYQIFAFKAELPIVKQWLNAIHPEDYRPAIRRWKENLTTQQVHTQQYRIIVEGQVKWIKTIYSPLFNEANQLIGYVGSLEDFTQSIEVEEKEVYHRAFRELLIEIMGSFINVNLDELEQQVQKVLEKIALFVGYDRIRIFELNEDKTKSKARYQYIAVNTPTVEGADATFDLRDWTWWMKQMEQNQLIEINDFDDLPTEATFEKYTLKKSGIQSLFALPMFFQEQLYGYITFASAKQKVILSQDSKHILRLLAQVFANLLNRMAIRQKLKESQDLYRLLADNITDLITLHDTQLTYQYITPSMTPMLGYSLEELLGTTSVPLVHPDDLQLIEEKLAQTVSGMTTRVTYRFLHKEGHYLWVESDGKIITDPQTGEIKVLVVSRDVSKRIEVTQALQSSQTLLATIFDESTDAIILVGKNGLIEDCNQRTLELFEASQKEELIGKSGFQLEVATDKYENFSELNQAIAEKSIIHRKVQYKTLKENHFWANFAAKKLRIGGENKILVTLTDITLLHQANKKIESLLRNARQLNEQLTQQNEQLLQANQELDNFVYSVSHDLRAPLTSAMGLITISKEEEDLATLRNYLSLQEKSLKKLDRFIHEIVDYSRNSRLAIIPKRIDFESLIQENFEQLKFMEQEIHIEKIIHIAPQLEFYSDSGRLSIIFSNLFSNAIRYADPQKNHCFIKVEVKSIDNQIVIAVIDNGQGIDERHLSRIFDMFYRATDNKPGSGLGLYILKEALKKIKGRVEVDSTLGEGTTFTLYLPNLATSETP